MTIRSKGDRKEKFSFFPLKRRFEKTKAINSRFCSIFERLKISAAREATVNAAKHARSPVVDLYSEVGGSAVEVFVRDRGTGFDPESIPADRQGVRNSIVDRMSRHGGTAEIRSTPGAGTEVRLKMPFQARQETTS